MSDCEHLNVEEFTDGSLRCDDCCRVWADGTKALANETVAFRAIALVRSGYDGPFMGEAVAALFEAVAMHERALAASTPAREGAKPKAPCCGHPYASHDIGKGCTEAGCVCLPGWLPVADPPRAPEAPKALETCCNGIVVDGRHSAYCRAPSQEPETT